MTQNLIVACLIGVYWLRKNPRDRWHLLPEQEAILLDAELICRLDNDELGIGIDLTSAGRMRAEIKI